MKIVYGQILKKRVAREFQNQKSKPKELQFHYCLVREPVAETSKARSYSELFWNMNLNYGLGSWMVPALTAGKLMADYLLDAR